jgi:transcriptional regulator with XRE-family HTH domain
MAKLCENLKYLMDELAIGANELSERAGIKLPALYKIISGETGNPSVYTITPIARFFNVSIEQLIGDQPLPSNRTKGTYSPLFENRSLLPLCKWSEMSDWVENKSPNTKTTVTIDFPASAKAIGILIDKNEYAPFFPEGTILIIDPEVIPSNKSYVVVKNKHLLSLKKIFIDGEKYYLKPVAIDVQPTLMQAEESIYGKIIEFKIRSFS